MFACRSSALQRVSPACDDCLSTLAASPQGIPGLRIDQHVIAARYGIGSMRIISALAVHAAQHGFVSAVQAPLLSPAVTAPARQVSQALFDELEEHSRLVDITYCVGTGNTGVSKPFTCLSRCSDFPSFELVASWNTGPLLTDSCGYIALSHAPAKPRIIVAFRGTYSITNAVADLTTIRQEYLPYPASNDTDKDAPRCEDCAVHMGFFNSWRATSETVMTQVADLKLAHPDYALTLIGHSLGGAVAALAALEMDIKGYSPTITTFGEPRIGNEGLARYIDARFGLGDDCNSTQSTDHTASRRYRRVTHVDDPVPLLPLTEWGFVPQAGEIFINKSAIPPEVTDLHHCCGSADKSCIAGQDASLGQVMESALVENRALASSIEDRSMSSHHKRAWGIPARYKLWQLLFAHRDYFWRLGLCLPSLGKGWNEADV